MQGAAIRLLHCDGGQAGRLCQGAIKVIRHAWDFGQRDAQAYGAANLQGQRLGDRLGHGLDILLGFAVCADAQLLQ